VELPIAALDYGQIAVRRPPQAPGGPITKAKAREVAEEFEAVFLSSMLNSMFTGLDSKGPFSGGPSEEIYRSMFVDQIGKSVAARGGLGIADSIYQQILRLQQVKP
jgi:Rod binding domain-containing protein